VWGRHVRTGGRRFGQGEGKLIPVLSPTDMPPASAVLQSFKPLCLAKCVFFISNTRKNISQLLEL
jgi:hypothetical protein